MPIVAMCFDPKGISMRTEEDFVSLNEGATLNGSSVLQTYFDMSVQLSLSKINAFSVNSESIVLTKSFWQFERGVNDSQKGTMNEINLFS
jgi:hypothetical protein